MMIKSDTMVNVSSVTNFCQSHSMIGWIVLGLILVLLLVYWLFPCVFDCFSSESLCKAWNKLKEVLNCLLNFINGLFGNDCSNVSPCNKKPDCGCGCSSGDSGLSPCDDDSESECDDCDGSGSGGAGGSKSIRGRGNVVVNLPAVNVTVNGAGTGSGSTPPVIIPPVSMNIPNCSSGHQSHNSCSGNTGDDECEIIDSVYLCEKRYAITYLPGIIRVYSSGSSNVLYNITHNLGVLRSIRYEADKFIVEDAHSVEFEGVVVNNAITFTPVV